METRLPIRAIAVLAVLTGCRDRADDGAVCAADEIIEASDACNICQCVDGDFWGYVEWLGCSFGPGDDPDVLCMPKAVGDVEPVTPGVQPMCRIVASETLGSGETRVFFAPSCSRVAEGYTWPTDDADFCWFARTDPLHVGDPFDDLSLECQARRTAEIAIEIEVLRRPETAAELYEFTATCIPPEPACPGAPVYGDACDPWVPQPCLEAGALPSCADEACVSKWCTVGNDAACAPLPGVTCIPYRAPGHATEDGEDVGICALADSGPCKDRPGIECVAR